MIASLNPDTVQIHSHRAAVERHLNAHYGAELEEFYGWKHLGFASAYMNCLTERHIRDICLCVGIQFFPRHIHPANVAGMIIDHKDVSMWSGVTPTTFAAMRTDFSYAREAQLRMHAELQADHALPAYHAHTLRLLDAMLGANLLSPPREQAVQGAADLEAVTIRLGRFNKRVRAVLNSVGIPDSEM